MPVSASARFYRYRQPSDLGWLLAVAAIIMLGGGNWTMPLPRLPTELIALGVLVAALGSSRSVFPQRLIAEDWLLIAIGALGVAHLIPLPPVVWKHLPGRGFADAIDVAVFGAPQWRPLSLDPTATLRSLVTLLPPLAIYVAGRTADGPRLLAMLRGVMIAVAATIVIAIGQLLLRDADWLHFYPRGDYQYPVGLFTNHNHQALFLLCAIPLACFWARDLEPLLASTARSGMVIGVMALIGVVMALATASRTGMALILPAILATGFAWWRTFPVERTGQARKTGRKWLLGWQIPIVPALVLFLALGTEGLTGAFRRTAIADDQRWEFWPHVITAIHTYWPFGSGIGTFVEAYAIHEPLSVVTPSFLNHAHNEYLEIALEAGVVGVALTAAVLARLASATWKAWGSSPETLAGRAASISLGLIAVHSLVDYPARTFAIAAIAALCWALQARDQEAASPMAAAPDAMPARQQY